MGNFFDGIIHEEIHISLLKCLNLGILMLESLLLSYTDVSTWMDYPRQHFFYFSMSCHKCSFCIYLHTSFLVYLVLLGLLRGHVCSMFAFDTLWVILL